MPVPKLGGAGGVEHDPGQIVRTGLGIGANIVRSKSHTTPVTQLRQRDRILGPSGKVADTHIHPIPWIGRLLTLKLFLEEGK